MKPLRPARDAHSEIKRWEGREQRQSLSRSAPLGPTFLQPLKLRGGEKVTLKAILIERYAGDLVAIRVIEDNLPEGLDHVVWLLRGGFNSKAYAELLLRFWSEGKSVPGCFRLKIRLPPQLENNLRALNGIDRVAAIESMRSGGLIPALRSLNSSTCPSEIPWALIRQHFQDFQSE